MRASWVLLLAAAGCGRSGFDPPPDGRADAALDDGALDDGASGDAGLDGGDRPNRIFISSTTHTGNLGGLAGADVVCQARADAAALGGTFVALLYTLADLPAVRLAGSRGWVDLAGRVIGDTPESLEAATFNPLHVDELGAEVAITGYAWWGGHPTSSQTCMDWTSTVTDTNGTHVVSPYAAFDTDNYSNCGTPSRLICAEVGHSAAVTPPIETGRNAFVTVGPWTPGGGLASADAACQAEATAASLPGTYRAYLVTSTASAESRFATTGLPWRKVSGVRLTQTADALFGPTPVALWDSFIAMHADGSPTTQRAWTGSTADNCLDWSSASMAVTGTIGATHSAQRSRLQMSLSPCNSARPLLCFQD